MIQLSLLLSHQCGEKQGNILPWWAKAQISWELLLQIVRPCGELVAHSGGGPVRVPVDQDQP